jgi:6-pyruvoyltetrahydropterin/6-carboxytetrahydropterin synthase
MEIFKRYTFDAAHWLPHVEAGHQCGRLHGHTYSVELRLAGSPGARTGWLTDFGEVSRAWKTVEPLLDHQLLNDVPGLENPTCELLSVWLVRRLAALLPTLYAVQVQETPTSGCVCRIEDAE